MSDIGIEALRLRGVEIEDATRRPEGDDSGGFEEVLTDAIRDVNRVHNESDATLQSYLSGEPMSLHQVLLQVEKADMSFRLMMEVRNKLVDAYREVMRMQV